MSQDTDDHGNARHGNKRNDIERHYATDGIAERVLAAVRATLKPGEPVTSDALAPVDHFHGRGLAATREMVALLAPKSSDRILDIGSGIGGPARWIAQKYGCHVTGIDLTADFCRAANALNAATGLASKVDIVHGSALALPFADASFDRAYSQNVVMNIADKVTFYREARRVLKPGGILVLSNLARGTGPEPEYPAPWAATAANSFLSTLEQTKSEIAAAGLDILTFKDTSADNMSAQQAVLRRLETEGSPALSAHLIVGPQLRGYQINSNRSIIDGRIRSIEVVAQRPMI